ncbi:hypothetical protein WN944_029178 [Citrus x changshan-huyou]|uniref:Uncharacterized protein n=1 Tax=Citrus x changshan-huyou TaxID=2935761 RepID=A0AAP0LQ93_9ROSI
MSPPLPLIFCPYRHHSLATRPPILLSFPAVQVVAMEIKMSAFLADSPPLSVIAATKLAGFLIPTDTSGSTPAFSFSNGYKRSVAAFIFHV